MMYHMMTFVEDLQDYLCQHQNPDVIQHLQHQPDLSKTKCLTFDVNCDVQMFFGLRMVKDEPGNYFCMREH